MVNVDDPLEKKRALLSGEGNMSTDEVNGRIPRVVLDKDETALDHELANVNDDVQSILEQSEASSQHNKDDDDDHALNKAIDGLGASEVKEKMLEDDLDAQMLKQQMNKAAEDLMREFDGIPRKGDKGYMKEKLSEYIPEMDQKEMEEYLQSWSVTNKRTITEDTRYAVAKGLTTQKYIKPSHIEYILYGWDLRGDHNIVEVKNTLTAIKDVTTANIAGQRSFKKELSSITTGLTAQLNKIMKNITEPPKQLHVDVPQPKKFPTMASDKVPLERSPDPKAPLVRSFVEHNVTKRENNTCTSQTDSQDQLRLKAKRILKVAGINLTQMGNFNTDASAAAVVIQIAKEMTEKELEIYESGVYGKEVKKLLIESMVDAE